MSSRFTIEGHAIGEGAPCFVIAEIGINHGGSEEIAEQMIRAAAASGADSVKFQTVDADASYMPGTASWKEFSGKGLSLAAQTRLNVLARQLGMVPFSTPGDEASLDLMLASGMRAAKVSSGLMTNLPMLRAIGASGLPVILSTGMAELAEVTAAVDVLKQAGCQDLLIMQCTSLYPAPAPTLNLRAIITLREAFGCAVGFSDHSMGDHAAIASVALGASMIEKHFTLDRRLPGPDHLASLEPSELAVMIRRLRETAEALGDGVKTPTPEERKVAALVRRSWHMARALPAGSRLGEGDVVLKRPAGGLPAQSALLGRRLARALAADAPVTDADLERD